MTNSFAGLLRPTGSREPPKSPKNGCALGQEVSTATTFCHHRRRASVAENLPQNPYLTANTS